MRRWSKEWKSDMESNKIEVSIKTKTRIRSKILDINKVQVNASGLWSSR